VLVLTASEHRSQDRKQKAAIKKLAELISEAFTTLKYRRPTKLTYYSKLKRLEKKQRRGEVKDPEQC
jgi:ribosome-associated protein